MIRRVLARLRAALVADAPAGDTSRLDELDGVGARGPLSDWDETRPVGEVPPMTDGEARLWADIRDCRADAAWDEHVDQALAVVAPLPSRFDQRFSPEDYARAAEWGLDLASTAEVDR